MKYFTLDTADSVFWISRAFKKLMFLINALGLYGLYRCGSKISGFLATSANISVSIR